MYIWNLPNCKWNSCKCRLRGTWWVVQPRMLSLICKGRATFLSWGSSLWRWTTQIRCGRLQLGRWASSRLRSILWGLCLRRGSTRSRKIVERSFCSLIIISIKFWMIDNWYKIRIKSSGFGREKHGSLTPMKSFVRRMSSSSGTWILIFCGFVAFDVFE